MDTRDAGEAGGREVNDEREYLAATRWTPAEWGRDRAADWATAVRIGEPVKAGQSATAREGEK